MKTVKMRSDEDPDDDLYKKGRSRNRLNSVTHKEGPSDCQSEDIMLQCLPPEYDRIHQTHFEREGSNLADIRRIMSNIYLPAPTPTRQEVSRDAASSCRRRGGTPAT